LLTGPVNWNVIMYGIQNHEPTLRRLVTHARLPDIYGGSVDNNDVGHKMMEISEYRSLVGVGAGLSVYSLV
jgi:hypothetical protein